MGHKTKIGGTNYEVYSGKLLKGGTSYSVVKGKTKIGGTGHDINFKKKYTATLHDLSAFYYIDPINFEYPNSCDIFVEIDGYRYFGDDVTYNVTVFEDTTITVTGSYDAITPMGRMSGGIAIYLNNVLVSSTGNYSFLPTGNVDIAYASRNRNDTVSITMA